MLTVQAYYDAHPDECPTLEKLVIRDKDAKDRKVTSAVVWLLRGQLFLLTGLQRSYNDPNEELIVSFSKSYDVTLKRYHNILIRSIVSVSHLSSLCTVPIGRITINH